MKPTPFLFASVIFVAWLPSAQAEDCTTRLIPDFLSYEHDDRQHLSLAWSVQEDAYEQLREEVGGGISIGSIGIGGSLGEFKQNARRRAESLGVTELDESSAAIATSVLGNNALQAYAICEADNNKGLAIVASRIGQESYTIFVQFNAGGTTDRELPVRLPSSTNLASVSETYLVSEFNRLKSNGFGRDFTIEPGDPTREVTIDVAIGDRASKTLHLPPLRSTKLVEAKSRTLNQRLLAGAPAKLWFDPRQCGADRKRGRDNVLLCGYLYDLQYNAETDLWLLSGQHAQNNDFAAASYEVIEPGLGVFNAFNTDYMVDNAGTVKKNDEVIGRLLLADTWSAQ